MGLEAAILGNRLVKSLARKLARRTAGPGPFPSEIEVPATPDEWAVIVKLGRILGVAGYQKGKKAVFALPKERRDPADWAELRGVFATDSTSGEEDVAETFRRARHVAPADAVEALKDDEMVVRFVRHGGDEVREFLRMAEWATSRLVSDAPDAPTTLSQVGADILGDSKALRAGARREVFRRVLAAVSGAEPDDVERDVFARFGIEENPFTSFVTVFAPFSFTLADGGEFDHPARLFRAGLAVQLPRQTVLRMRAVRLLDGCSHLVTSENAAPFERMVRAGVPCLYTEGYPNAAVIRLLELFARRGATADHDGDGDLDGFLIADRVAKVIPVVRVVADDVSESADVPRRSVSPRARIRWSAYLASHPGFPHSRPLRFALDHGWLEQETHEIAAHSHPLRSGGGVGVEGG